MKTFDAYQAGTNLTAIYPTEVALVYLALGLASEAGEVAGKIKKHIRDGNELDREAMDKELGDVLWYVSELCTELDLHLGEVAEANIEKLLSRQSRGTLGGDGDER